jgi:long-chain acyl-CoA synthetase
MVESSFIEQIMVVGEAEKFVGALIVPAFRVLKEWYAQKGKPYPGDQAVVRDEQVRALIKEAVAWFNQQFNPVEQVKKFELLPREWSIEGGELTPTLKLKRKVILNKYQDIIAGIYK